MAMVEQDQDDILAQINIIPFVDILLVLLIIFMVAAPLLTVGVEVDMPDTAAQPLPNEQEEPLAVTMTADGRVMIMETEIAPEQIVPRLQSILAERTSNKIFIRADGALPYGNVAELMGALNAAGFRDIGLVTDPAGDRELAGAQAALRAKLDEWIKATKDQGETPNTMFGIAEYANGQFVFFNVRNVNYDGYANSRYTVAVSAIDHDGVQSYYSEPGAPILVAAYSSGDGVAPRRVVVEDTRFESGARAGDDADLVFQFHGIRSTCWSRRRR